MIGNAHLDPVWLWKWQDGVDEVLATYRTACDLLDEYPDFIFSHGEAWTYRQVELIDPVLFERIREHVRTERWEIVGGWWIQPDCNLPTGFGLQHQIELGKEYFLKKFGFFPDTAFNVDSFGHAAALPEYMHAAGQRNYVMMRPMDHELVLPARIFRWRGREDGPEITAFRVAGSYCTCTTSANILNADHVMLSLSDLPDDIEHTMCLYGVGDHGGGPTAESIRWIMENQDSFPGCRMVFSSPSRFFKAIASSIDKLPVVTGELQHHAIGCYTVERKIKTLLRRTEHALRRAELVSTSNSERPRLSEAWERVCFNQFHDILAGSCIPSAYQQCYAQLGYAATIADDVLVYNTRRDIQSLPEDPMQRMIFFNASDHAFDGYIETEPWLSNVPWSPKWKILDELSKPVAYQRLRNEVAGGDNRLLFRAKLRPGETRIFRIDRNEAEFNTKTGVTASADFIENSLGVGLHLNQRVLEFPESGEINIPQLELIDDRSDTWSHDIDHYSKTPIALAEWNEASVLYNGPILAALLQTGHIGSSRLQAQWRIYSGESFVELRLKVHWIETQKVLKLNIPLPCSIQSRIDGTPGFGLERKNDGVERPITDWAMFDFGKSRLGVVCPETFALDATPENVRFTLLRSPMMAHHIAVLPESATDPLAIIADQGPHEFVFRFHFGAHINEETLTSESLMLQRPPLSVSVTRGMPRIVQKTS